MTDAEATDLAPIARPLGRTRIGMERIGGRTALLLLAIIAAFMIIALGLQSWALASPRRFEPADSPLELGGPDGNSFSIAVRSGWDDDLALSSSSETVLHRGGLSARIVEASSVNDLGTYFDRTVRRVQINGIGDNLHDASVTEGQQPHAVGIVSGDDREALVAVYTDRDRNGISIIIDAPNGAFSGSDVTVDSLLGAVSTNG